MSLGLTCKVDSHGHNDDDDPHDDEGDAERPSQAAEPPGPVQVPLLHATSRLQREGGRNPVLSSLAEGPLPEPLNTPRSLLQPTLLGRGRGLLQEKWPGLKWPDLLWGSLTKLAHCWLGTAGNITEQCRALSQDLSSPTRDQTHPPCSGSPPRFPHWNGHNP